MEDMTLTLVEVMAWKGIKAMNKQPMSKNMITHCGIIGNVILLQFWGI